MYIDKYWQIYIRFYIFIKKFSKFNLTSCDKNGSSCAIIALRRFAISICNIKKREWLCSQHKKLECQMQINYIDRFCISIQSKTFWMKLYIISFYAVMALRMCAFYVSWYIFLSIHLCACYGLYYFNRKWITITELCVGRCKNLLAWYMIQIENKGMNQRDFMFLQIKCTYYKLITH